MTQLYDLRPVWHENSRAVRSPHWQCPLLHPLHWSCNLCSNYFVDTLCLALYLAYGSLVLLPSLLAWSQTSLITADLSYGNLWSAGCMCPLSALLFLQEHCGPVTLASEGLPLPPSVWPSATHLPGRAGSSCCSLASPPCLHQSLHLPAQSGVEVCDWHQ